MAGPVVNFTEVGRARLAKFLGIAHWICILPSLLCLLTALFVQTTIEDKIFFLENYNGAVLPGFLVFTGFYGLLAHILCGKAIFSNRIVTKRKKWMAFLLPALIATFVIFLAEFIGGIMCVVHMKDMRKSFDAGIWKSMRAYKNDATAKESLDVLQMSYKCCGSRSYSDYFSVEWIHPDFISTSQAFGQRAGDSGKDVPFSCCNPRVLRPCIYRNVHDNVQHFNYDYRTQTTLHVVGCTDRLVKYYEKSILKIGGAVVLSLSFVQTAIQSVDSDGDPTSPSVGYLLTAPADARKQKVTELDTTATTSDGGTLEVSGETTLTEDDGAERYVYIDATPETEVSYENEPPFKIASNLIMADDDEHIYNEGEVEEYLAARYAQSRQLFDSSPELLPEPPPEEPIYENIASVGKDDSAQVKSGTYMPMNISNSSMQELQTHPSHLKFRRQPSSDIRMHSYPSPVGESGPIVIDLSTDFSPNIFSRHSGMHRSSNKMRPLGHGPVDRSRSLEKSRSSQVLIHHSTPKGTPVYQGPVNRHISSEKQRLLGPPSASSSVYRDASGSPSKKRSSRRSPSKDRGDGLSPRKRRSPLRYVSPEKTTFRFGTSYDCNHAL
ncbi:peripherin-2-like isoform X2 [Dreissena polymorpha]|uniref:peripherin-2-like isoform X2 n=1 Tax=Dreissena polymorpha TaxID=45954 RepID=UPI002265140D|nr:peripherin-2-like isoform X2 [Dreissena polymorpha]